MTPRTANRFVRCSCGRLHWGAFGAAGLLLCDPERGVLMQRRAWWVHNGGTWALPGGALEIGETARSAAAREAWEEADVPVSAFRAMSAFVLDHGVWQYTTVLGMAGSGLEARVANPESTELRWIPPDEVPGLKLHRDFARSWPLLRAQLGRELVLVVDAANVLGSRPDGWWRDRRGATERLRDRLATLAGEGLRDPVAGVGAGPAWQWWPRVVLVVEGEPRTVPSVPGVEVAAADADGDAKLVEVAAQARERAENHVVAVTADRELRDRVSALGAQVLEPGALLRELG
ncbi:NUDIX domain-containing protein [Amycolatopsis jiangsuensis]|uniref:8-oxo-dGTP pyrophosphatase MutT (NUDIX family) n=1 Tax=Amycolatopsis jiangsuensis TaxID=1181879 RepID=A0A840IRA9_9PSEU|nr:NUDIX domain-containing protein [Amycolatopsis jiangsuensis]MBB4684926.1 8-oxo-dGTP pyrophosphatase MutT (NUDIX family) [Amycolatopsis jiangsuensis]